jgi:hypothetical protein
VLLCLVSAVLALAGLLKLQDPMAFALAIANYDLLPRQALQPLAFLLPPLEIVTALALLSPRYRRAAWMLAAGLFLLFAGAVGSALARGLDVSCGCFGGAARVSWLHLVANLALLALCLWQIRRQPMKGQEPLVTG